MIFKSKSKVIIVYKIISYDEFGTLTRKHKLFLFTFKYFPFTDNTAHADNIKIQ